MSIDTDSLGCLGLSDLFRRTVGLLAVKFCVLVQVRQESQTSFTACFALG